MYDGEHQQIKKYMEGVTGKRNMNVIVIKEDLSHIYAISEALKNNELGLHACRRFVEGNKTMACNFLGAARPGFLQGRLCWQQLLKYRFLLCLLLKKQTCTTTCMQATRSNITACQKTRHDAAGAARILRPPWKKKQGYTLNNGLTIIISGKHK